MKTIKVLVLKHKNFKRKFAEKEIQKVFQYYRNKGLTIPELVFDIQTVSVELEYEAFIKGFSDHNLKGKVVDLYGQKNIKEKLRPIAKKEHDLVAFIYKSTSKERVACWAYPSPFTGQSPFMELPDSGSFVANFTHELIHCFHRYGMFRNIYTPDTMDLYDHDLDPYKENGNYHRNLIALQKLFTGKTPHTPTIVEILARAFK